MSVLNPKIFDSLPEHCKTKLQPYENNLKMADGHNVRPLGTVKLPLLIDNQYIYQIFVIADIDIPIVLGYDFMYNNQCVIDVPNKNILLNSQTVDCHLESQIPSLFKISIDEQVTIPPNSETIIHALPNEKLPYGTTMILDNTSQSFKNKGVLVAKSICTFKGDNLPLRVMNLTDLPQTLYKNTCAGTAETICSENILGNINAEPELVLPEHMQVVMEKCKKALITSPILTYPCIDKEFILDTDASGTGVGAVLSQINDEGKECVIAYFSRTLSKHCDTRDVTEVSFQIENPTIRAINMLDENEIEETPIVTNWFNNKTPDEFKQAQLDDPIISQILTWKKSPEKPKWPEISHLSQHHKTYWSQWERLTVVEGILYRKWENTTTNDINLQYVLPCADRNRVLLLLHNDQLGGHLGFKRTIARIRHRFYWAGYTSFVERWCKRCTECQKRNQPSHHTRGQMKSYIVGEPMERVSLDILGPVTRTYKDLTMTRTITTCTLEEPIITTPEEPITTTPEEPITTTPEEPITTTPEEPNTTHQDEILKFP
ncbi:unnamed protein product [Mytilus edulis]|uniref:Integrase zinc-binding domain-containing protein n=1 Tax=Mytilus edulis TaxID=6550 RepID=A0A8S3TQ26_MYTED|nr:unnamed protein product [Mytilus edulis]